MKITPFGVAVLETDTHISRWVERHGRLDIQRELLWPWLKNVREGDTVIDCGAFIGDTMMTLKEKVGKTGIVLAFEPGPEAFECLVHNRYHLNASGIEIFNNAVGNVHPLEEAVATFNRSDNAGASRLSGIVEGSSQGVPVVSINEIMDKRMLYDEADPVVSFIKIDVEGWEEEVLWGALLVIERNRPDLFIEINHGALAASDSNMEAIHRFLKQAGYTWEIIDPRLKESDPQYDIYCTHKDGINR